MVLESLGMHRVLLRMAIFGCVWLPWLTCGRAAETLNAANSAEQVRSQRNIASNTDRSLSLTGVVTLVDADRGLLVLQDETGAVALHMGVLETPVRPGQRVSLKAKACAPYVASCPGYPYRPAGGEVLSLFETPQNEGDYRLTRMRAWLRPPVSGEYTFWISSDDSSELWLSPNANPDEAERVAMVPSANWTDYREWSRLPSQRSEKVRLQAGESYFIEALQEQMLAGCHLEVAWAGPGIERGVIDGRHLVPWDHSPDVASPGKQGVLRQYWTDYSVGALAPVSNPNWAFGELVADGVEIVVLGEGDWPEPLRIEPSQVVDPNRFFRWVEGEGRVGFIAIDGRSLTLEITSGQNRMQVRVADWKNPLPVRGKRLRAKFRGVCEGGRDTGGHWIAGCVRSPSASHVTILEDTGASSPDAADPASVAPATADPTLGGFYFTRGVVTFSGKVLGEDCLFVQESFGGVFISQAERRILPTPRAGNCVEIGGNFLPRQFAPAIRPATMNILGWQSFPIPVTPAGEAEFRDGQWTELEGVVRAVNPDGTVRLSGRQSGVRLWVDGAGQADLEKLVNGVVRARGVMSLGYFGKPILLAPSREFVDVTEAPPDRPARPMTVASIGKAESAWVRQVRIAGMVTFGDGGRGFHLQDSTGALRVELLHGECPPLGSNIEVLGFPEMREHHMTVTESVELLRSPGVMPAPVKLDPERAESAMEGVLVSVKARVLSRKRRGTVHVMEMQADRHVFEAVLASVQNRMPWFETGSLLELTGVCVLNSAAPSAALQQVLLRSPSDISLLEGPPWWTWRRTAALIGVLLAVLAGSLLRIFMLNRRFARQQAARLAFTRGMLESQESERRRIAASLHDSLGQDLLVIRNQTHLAIQSSGEESALRQRLEEISGTTLQAINEVREITHNLRPYQLDRLGLAQSIRAITRKVSENSPMEFACHVDEIDGIFDSESEIHIYRIVQEGINNVLKHSGASEATVVVKTTGGNLSISIRDNGRGFPTGAGETGNGFGLSGIRERAEIMGGTARIDSSPDQGVSLLVQLPIQKPTP